MATLDRPGMPMTPAEFEQSLTRFLCIRKTIINRQSCDIGQLHMGDLPSKGPQQKVDPSRFTIHELVFAKKTDADRLKVFGVS